MRDHERSMRLSPQTRHLASHSRCPELHLKSQTFEDSKTFGSRRSSRAQNAPADNCDPKGGVSTVANKTTLLSQIRKNGRMIEWLYKNKPFFSEKMNGHPNVPENSYPTTLPLIDRGGKIIDLGCGNGMLLKFLLQFSGHHLMPYGIDLNKEAIQQAKTDVLPEYADNFAAGNIKDYGFREGPFDIIISSPFYSLGNPKDFTKKCMNALKPKGKLIYFFYYDVFRRLGITSLDECEYLDGVPMLFSYGREILFGTIYKK